MERVRIAAAIGVTALLVACGEKNGQTQTTPDPSAGAPTASAPSPAPTPAAPSSPTPSATPGGKVLETMNSGGYTYAKLGLNGKEAWFAGPETELAVGDVITVGEGMAMKNFKSNTLNRTFEEIYFLGGWGDRTAAQPSAAGATPEPTAEPKAKQAEGGEVALGTITPVEGGVTIEALYAKKDELAGQSVAVRGKVVKFNPGIMARNWIHLQDGTGAAGTNDVTVTTQGMVSVGDVVVVRGTLTIDKDFGAGYRYDLIIEDATVEAK